MKAHQHWRQQQELVNINPDNPAVCIYNTHKKVEKEDRTEQKEQVRPLQLYCHILGWGKFPPNQFGKKFCSFF